MPTEKYDFTKSDLFFEEYKQIHQLVAASLSALEEQSYAWMDEILQVAKKGFQEDDTCLLPKTPSAKRKGRGRVKRSSNTNSPRRNILESSIIENETDQAKGAKKRDQSEVSMSDDENLNTPSNKVLLIESAESSDDDFVKPARPTRATRATSRAAATTSRAKNTKKGSKAKKNKSDSLFKNLEVDLVGLTKSEELDGAYSRKAEDRLSSEMQTDETDSKQVELSRFSTPKSGRKSKECAERVEEWIQPANCNTVALQHRIEPEGESCQHKSPTTPKQNSNTIKSEQMKLEKEAIIYLTPVQENKNKKRSKSLPITPENRTPVTQSACDTPATVKTNKTRSSDHGITESFYEEVVDEEMPALPGVGPNGYPSEKKAPPKLSMTRTRASLKTLPSKQKEIDLHAPMQVDEQPVRTRTRLRLKKKDKERESDADNASVASTEAMETNSKETSNSGTDKDEDKPTEADSQGSQSDAEVRSSTRTKTRQAKKAETTSRDDVISSRDNSTQRVLRSSLEGVDTNKDSGVGGSCGSSEDELPRATRSKMRKPKEENKEQEETRSTRTKTRKRQLDEEEAASTQPKRSRSCYNQELEDEDKATPTNKIRINENRSDSDDVASPACPRNKVVRPHPQSFLNKFKPLNTKLNTTPLRGAQINPGLVMSFIKPTISKEPTLKEIQEKKKKDLLEKQKKQEELQRKREVEHKKRMEECRRKREEKMRKVQECREMKAKQEQESRLNLEKKMAEKKNLTLKLREEKLKEEREKQKLRLQKFEEAEERRKREEEEQKKKLLEQLEHERLQAESMQRKKELEEQERQKKMEEERQRALERQQELERERERERERLAKIKEAEDEKHREWLKKKEERERIIAKEKADRERHELEKRKEQDLQLKREMERIREQDKLRLAEQERIREQQKKQDNELKKMVEKHNAQVQNPQSTLPKPNLNKTHSLTEPTVTNNNKSRNDSYEMTPDRVYKPATSENYCIDDIKSDDETDDDEAPRKKVPDWAQGAQLKASLIKQHLHPPSLDLLFDVIVPPDLNQMFEKKKARFNKRTSSAHWDEPILKPGLLGRK